MSKPRVDVSWLYKQVETNQIGQALGLTTEDMIEMFRNSLSDGSKSDQEIEQRLAGIVGRILFAVHSECDIES